MNPARSKPHREHLLDRYDWGNGYLNTPQSQCPGRTGEQVAKYVKPERGALFRRELLEIDRRGSSRTNQYPVPYNGVTQLGAFDSSQCLLLLQLHSAQKRIVARIRAHRIEPRRALDEDEIRILLDVRPFKPLKGLIKFAASSVCSRNRRGPVVALVFTNRSSAALDSAFRPSRKLTIVSPKSREDWSAPASSPPMPHRVYLARVELARDRGDRWCTAD